MTARAAGAKRPVRLWIVGVINVLTCLTSIGGLVGLTVAKTVPAALRPGALTWILSGALLAILLVSTLLTLSRRPPAQYVMLAAAVVFFGLMMVQIILVGVSFVPHDDTLAHIKLFASMFRSATMLALNVWATLSQPTRDFMARGCTRASAVVIVEGSELEHAEEKRP